MLAANVDPESENFKKTHDDLEKLYDEIAEGIRIRSKCDWYECGEKSTKFFLNLEKKNAKSSTITKLNTGSKIISNQKEILDEINIYYTNLFKNNNDQSQASCKRFLDNLSTPTLDNEDILELSNEITKNEIFTALNEMSNERSPGNDGLPCEFYKKFWEELEDVYFDSISLGRLKKLLSISQRQAIIRLLEKKDKDKTVVNNWRPISLLNVDLKIISKVIANRLKKYYTKL